MNWLFILVWLTMSSCTFVDAKLWGHKEEAEVHVHASAEHGGVAAHAKEKVCEAADKMCHDERAKRLELETEGRMAHAAHSVKDKLSEAAHHIKGENEEMQADGKRHLHHAREKVVDAKDSAMENTRHAGEKVKHGFEEAYESTASNLKSAKEKVQHHATSTYDQASAKAAETGEYVKGKIWGHTEKPVGFLHFYFPGFHAWLAIFMAIGAQLALGWLWYGMLFRKPFIQALQEDRLTNTGAFLGEGKAFAVKQGMSDKLAQAGNYVKDSAVAGKLTDAAHKFSNSAAGQKLSQTGEFVKEKVAAGTASIQHAATTAKDRAEQTAFQAKDKIAGAAHSAQDAASDKFSQMTSKDTTYSAAATTTTSAPTTATHVDATAGTQTDWAAGPYSVMWGPIASLFTSIIRAFFMFHWLKVLMVHTTSGALAMAFAFFIGSQFLSMHHYVWEGRPLKLLILDHGCELALALTTSFIVYRFGVAK